jgi:hypothetical protein
MSESVHFHGELIMEYADALFTKECFDEAVEAYTKLTENEAVSFMLTHFFCAFADFIPDLVN